MTPENFCYWLRGYFELEVEKHPLNMPCVLNLTNEQMLMIKKHLDSVFTPTIMKEPGPGEPFTYTPMAGLPVIC